jgi:hypothetical protein
MPIDIAVQTKSGVQTKSKIVTRLPRGSGFD